jgi:hypothetical protein
MNRDCPVTDHQQDFCELEIGSCRSCGSRCPPYGYCTSESHKGTVAPNWPCTTALRALGQTRKQWIEQYDREMDEMAAALEAEMAAAVGVRPTPEEQS